MERKVLPWIRRVSLGVCVTLAVGQSEVWALAPGNVTLNTPSNPKTHSLTLSWTQSTDTTTFKEYRLYRSLTASVDTNKSLAAKITARSTISYIDTLLRAATKYYYKVFVVDTGGVFSTGSNEVNGTTLPNAFPFIDSAETNTSLRFTADGLWGLSQSEPHSGSNSWTDSPIGTYANSVDASLTTHIDLSTARMPVLTFWTRFGTEVNADYGRVEVSIGSGWTVAGYWSGSQSTWKRVRVDLTPWAGSSDVTIRWRFVTNTSTVSDGWYLDDFSIAETPTAGLGYPFIDSFDDSTSLGRWHMSQWEIITDGRSTPGRMHDSPTGNYLQSGGAGASDDPNSFTSLTASGVIDLSTAVEPVLTFWQKYDLAASTGGHDQEWDYGRVYISSNYGLPGSWTQLYYVNGSNTSAWQRVELDLTPYVGSPTIRLRFVLDDQRDQDPSWGGDNSEARDGWWIDDIRVENRPTKVTLNAPTNVSMHGVTLGWSQNSDPDFGRYEIYRSTTADVDRSDLLIATITNKLTTSYRDNYQILQPSIYYYRVYIVDSLETVSSGSNIVSATYTVPTVTFPFSDSVEVAADTAKWAWSYPWGRATGKAHSGAYSWTDSPGSSYGPNTNSALSTNVNLSLSTQPVLTFWHQYSLETNGDFGHVEISTNGGSTWTTVHSITGVDTVWKQVRIDFSAYIGGTIGLRFRMSSNGSNQLDGWYLDDIVIDNGTRVNGFPFTEGFESGFSRWFVENPWGLTGDNPHGGTYAITESPSGTYSDNTSSSLLLRMNLSSAQMPVLTFWTRYSMESNGDYGRVEVSTGSGWTIAGYWTGGQSTWKQVRVDLTPWTGSSDVAIRWRFTSNSSTISDGWYLDDLSIAETTTPTLSYPFLESFDDSTSKNKWFWAQWEVVTDGHSTPGRIHDSPVGYYLQSGGTTASRVCRCLVSLT